jgi:GNAT superfamily N-acetyltransferase
MCFLLLRHVFSASLTKDEIDHRIRNKYQLHTFREEVANSENHFFGIYKNKTIIGYIHISKSKPPSCVALKNGMQLNRIYYLKEFQKHGFGKQTRKFIENYASQRSHDGIFLYCYEMNLEAIHFYEQNGYRIVGKEPFTILVELLRYDVVMEKFFG